MSSLRNAVKRITHKERSQPQDRSHLGILEKKKDYQQRAKHYHAQQDRLKRLQERAAQRNPDEFYFGMQRSQVQNGKHTHTNEKDDYRHLDPQLVRIMKDQDLKFVRMQQQQDSKAAAKLQASLHRLNNDDEHSHHPNGRKHTVFVETQQEAQDFDVATHFDTLPQLAHRSFNRLRKCNVEQIMAMANNNNNHNNIVMNNGGGETATTNTTAKSSSSLSKPKLALLKLQQHRRQQARQLAKAKELAYRELQARQDRARSLRLAEQHLVTEKLVASKGRKRKIAAAASENNGQPAQYKWRRRRSK
jgi:U3 small nucleolar RNA-associated protein 11